MAADTKVYDPDQISIVVCGIPIIGGFPEGSMVDIDQDDDSFTEVVGTLGDVTRSKKLNYMTTITVRLLQSSDSNALFSALYNLDINTPNGAGIGTTEIKDLSGTSLYLFAKSWIAKPPKVSFDAQDTPREWKIRGYNTLRVDGGQLMPQLRQKLAKEINGVHYEVFQLGALQGRKVLVRLHKVVGPAMAKMAATGDWTAALATLAEDMSEPDFEYFCDVFAPLTEVTTEPGKTPKLSNIFDNHFVGDYFSMLEWLVFCIEVNFGSFLARIREGQGSRASQSDAKGPAAASL